MKEKRTGNGRRDIDKCICENPFRYNDKKIASEIDQSQKEIVNMWKIIDTKLTVKMFGIVMTLLVMLLIAVGTSMNSTNQKTLLIVTNMIEDVQEIKSQQEILKNLLPASFVDVDGW